MTTTLNLTFGTHVYCCDQDCGKLVQVAIDPITAHIVEIVVEYGLPFFKHNRVLPFTAIDHVREEAIQLTIASKQWDEYPEYREVAVNAVDAATGEQQRQGISIERALLYDGVTAQGRDGVAGQLDHLLVEPTTGQLTQLALRRGFLQRDYLLVPVEQVTFSREVPLQINLSNAELAQLPHYQHQGEDAILADLAAQLRAESAAFAGVHAAIVAGVVQLSGQVASRALQLHAEELAQTIPGVREVRNAIQVVDGHTPPTPSIPTDEVAAAIDYALRTDTRLAQRHIQVSNEKGIIHLRGQVNTIAEQLLAENLATSQPGVTSVVNELTVQPAPALVGQPEPA